MEIVEQEVERVLPGSFSAFWFVKNSAFWLVKKFLAFRAAMHCELLKEDEVKLLLQDRKREEAKLVKREAQKDDFINFVARDSIMLKLLQKRRKTINYTHKMAEIEYVFLQGGFIILRNYQLSQIDPGNGPSGSGDVLESTSVSATRNSDFSHSKMIFLPVLNPWKSV